MGDADQRGRILPFPRGCCTLFSCATGCAGELIHPRVDARLRLFVAGQGLYLNSSPTPQEAKTEVDSRIKDAEQPDSWETCYALWAHLDNSDIFWDRYLIGQFLVQFSWVSFFWGWLIIAHNADSFFCNAAESIFIATTAITQSQST